MRNGIKELADNGLGRVEISDPKEIKRLTLQPSKKAVQRIERIEELTFAAEQHLGNFVVGTREG